MSLPLSKAKKKFFASLATAKGRRDHGLFLAEGRRGIAEMARSDRFRPACLLTLSEASEFAPLVPPDNHFIASAGDLRDISSLVTPSDTMMVFTLPEPRVPLAADIRRRLTLALDAVQDPGNLGTIIRSADWWGVSDIICSRDTVDCFSPKVVQASKGALARVNVVKVGSLPAYLGECRAVGLPVCGTFLDGQNLFEARLPSEAVLVMGNEGNGISAAIEELVDRRLTIPSYPAGAAHVESLNVAMAASIALARFRYPR